MKSKLLKKLRKQFADQYQVKFEVGSCLLGYHPWYCLYTQQTGVFTGKKIWSLYRSFKTESEVKEFLRAKYEDFIEDYLSKNRDKRLRNELTYPW